MIEYKKPTIEIETVEATDVILISKDANGIRDEGNGTLGTVSGEKGVFESLFSDLL